MTGYLVSRLREQGLKAESVYDITDPSIVILANEQYARDCILHSRGDNPEINGAKLLPSDEYFQTPRGDAEYLRLADNLKSMGYRYLVELTAMDISAQAPGLGSVEIIAKPNARVINLRTNSVVWTTQFIHSAQYFMGGDLHALEQNNMAKTKEGLIAGINRLDFLSAWGMR